MFTSAGSQFYRTFSKCGTTLFPDDRPSALFSLFNVVINGALLVWSFAVLLANDCSSELQRWSGLGMLHCFVNMIFAVAVMANTRRLIHHGIDLNVKYLPLVLFDPCIAIYLLYLVWEIIWMAVVIQRWSPSSSLNCDACCQHFNVQVGFLAFYLFIGVLMFWLTFITEFMQLPAWRRLANVRWYNRQRPDLFAHDNEGTANESTRATVQDAGRRYREEV